MFQCQIKDNNTSFLPYISDYFHLCRKNGSMQYYGFDLVKIQSLQYNHLYNINIYIYIFMWVHHMQSFLIGFDFVAKISVTVQS